MLFFHEENVENISIFGATHKCVKAIQTS